MKFLPLVSGHSTLTHMYNITIPKGSCCRSLALAEENKLVAACSNHLVMYDLTTKKTPCINSNASGSNNIQSIDLLKEHSQVYSLNWYGVVNCLPKDLSSRSAIFSDAPCRGRLCVTGKFVTMCDSKGNCVLIYNTKTMEKRSYDLAEHAGGRIHSICSAPDDSILTLDGVKGIVCCHRLHENTTPTLRWACTAITGGYAICSDDQGFVYVSAEGRLYVLLEGKHSILIRLTLSIFRRLSPTQVLQVLILNNEPNKKFMQVVVQVKQFKLFQMTSLKSLQKHSLTPCRYFGEHIRMRTAASSYGLRVR